MSTLEQDYARWKHERETAVQDEKDRQLEEEYAAYKKDQAQGGSVRQGSPSVNPPIGATVGGMIGAGTGLAVTGGNPAGAMIGGIGGTFVGELAQQGYELLKDPGAAPRSVGESAARVAESEAYQAVGEGIGRLAGGLIAGRQLAPGIPASILPHERQAMNYLTQKGYSTGYLPSEVTEVRGLDMLQNIAEFSIFGGGAIKKFRDKRDREVLQELAQGFIDDLGPRMSADDIGRAVVHSVNRGMELEQIPIQMEYNTIEKLAAPSYAYRPTRIQTERDTEPIVESVIDKVTVKKKEKVTPAKPGLQSVERGTKPYDKGFVTPGTPEERELLGMKAKVTYQDIQIGEQLKRLKVMMDQSEFQISGARIDLTPLKEQIAGALKIAKEAGGLEDKAMGENLLSFIKNKPDLVSYPMAKHMRTEVRVHREGLEAMESTKVAPAIQLANEVYGAMTKQIEKGLHEFDPGLAERWKDVNFREAAAHARFSNDITRALVQHADKAGSGKPEAIVEKVFQRNNISTIQNLKNAVDAPTWENMLSWHWRNVYEKTGGDGQQMRNAFFSQSSGLGEKEMVTAYGPERVKQYKDFVNAAEVAQLKQGDKTGSMFIQLKQPGAVVQLAGATMAAVGLSRDDVDFGQVAMGGTIAIGPAVLAKLMVNPKSAQWIIDGMKIPAGTREAAALATRILPLAFPRITSTIAEPEAPPSKTGLAPMTPMPMGQQP